MWGNEIVFNLTGGNTILKTECVCFTAPWLNGDAFRFFKRYQTCPCRPRAEARGGVGPPPGRTQTSSAAASLLPSGILGFRNQFSACCPGPPALPHSAPVFVTGHHTWYFSKRHPPPHHLWAVSTPNWLSFWSVYGEFNQIHRIGNWATQPAGIST